MTIRIDFDVGVPLRDGTRLSATLYKSDDQREPRPAVVVLTPYIADIGHERGMRFAREGYTVAIVNVRGRGNSEGAFRPYAQEAQDGHDVVTWLSRQPFCDGRVVMQGGSYSGYAQWSAARSAPPGLVSIIPTASPFLGLDFPMRNNIRYAYAVQWLAFTAGRCAQAKIHADQDYWSGRFLDWYRSGRCFGDLDVLAWSRSDVFQEWIAHPEYDAYWSNYNPSPDDYARMSIPILTITGAYDDDQVGAIEHYRRHVAATDAEDHYLVIGPWDHAGTAKPVANFGGAAFAEASLVDMFALHADWYEWVLGKAARPAFLQGRVCYYTTGSDIWQYADSLDRITASRDALYLGSSACANGLAGSGALTNTAGDGAPDSFRFDPRSDDHLSEIEAAVDIGSLVDQSLLVALGDRALVYHSAPLTQDVEISGFFALHAWIAIDSSDADIYVSIHEIDEQGESLLLATDAMRARYRYGLEVAVGVEPTKPELYKFERFTFISRLVRAGRRLRLVIAPRGKLVDSLFAERNAGSGGRVADEEASRAHTLTVSVFHDPSHRSVLNVPIGRESHPADLR